MQDFPLDGVEVEAVDRQHHGRPLEALERLDGAVEDVVGLERLPVGGRPLVAEELVVDGVTSIGRENGDGRRRVALGDQPGNDPVGVGNRPTVAGAHQADGRTLRPSRLDEPALQRVDDGRDLLRVAQVLVQLDLDAVERDVAASGEDALQVVLEHHDGSVRRVAQGRQQRRPPVVGEVLRLVHDEQVEALVGLLSVRGFGEPAGQAVVVRRADPGVASDHCSAR